VNWSVYVLVSERATLTYVGISNDVDRRLQQHNGNKPGGARSTRAGRPWRVGIIYGPYGDRGEASRVEYRVKQLRGKQRLQWLDGGAA